MQRQRALRVLRNGSVDLYDRFFALANGCSAHDNANCLCNAALLADNAAHIILCNVQMIHDGTVLAGIVHSYSNCVLVLYKAPGNCH